MVSKDILMQIEEGILLSDDLTFQSFRIFFTELIIIYKYILIKDYIYDYRKEQLFVYNIEKK